MYDAGNQVSGNYRKDIDAFKATRQLRLSGVVQNYRYYRYCAQSNDFGTVREF